MGIKPGRQTFIKIWTLRSRIMRLIALSQDSFHIFTHSSVQPLYDAARGHDLTTWPAAVASSPAAPAATKTAADAIDTANDATVRLKQFCRHVRQSCNGHEHDGNELQGFRWLIWRFYHNRRHSLSRVTFNAASALSSSSQ